MNLKEFQEEVNKLAKEIMYENGKLGSHNIEADVQFTLQDKNGEDFALLDSDGDEVIFSAEMVRFDVNMLPGCGCWSGIDIVLKVEED